MAQSHNFTQLCPFDVFRLGDTDVTIGFSLAKWFMLMLLCVLFFQGDPISEDDMFVAVKTCKKFHKSRGRKVNILYTIEQWQLPHYFTFQW